MFAMVDLLWLAGGIFLGVRYRDAFIAFKDKLVAAFNWIKAKV
jgi:hypothetical protein